MWIGWKIWWWKQKQSCFISLLPLGSVDDCEQCKRDSHQQAIIQAQQHRRDKGHQPDDLREKRGKRIIRIIWTWGIKRQGKQTDTTSCPVSFPPTSFTHWFKKQKKQNVTCFSEKILSFKKLNSNNCGLVEKEKPGANGLLKKIGSICPTLNLLYQLCLPEGFFFPFLPSLGKYLSFLSDTPACNAHQLKQGINKKIKAYYFWWYIFLFFA